MAASTKPLASLQVSRQGDGEGSANISARAWFAAVALLAAAAFGVYLLRRAGSQPADQFAHSLRRFAHRAAPIAVFAVTYVAVAVGRLPGLRIDRSGAALVGASLMVGCGALSLNDAYRAVDFGTITLLLGMMIVVANLRLAGLFSLACGWIETRARHPLTLLIATVLLSGSLSAFLVNDAICLVLTPIVIELVARRRRSPVPYLLAVAMASNVGSVATITGNPQNIIIGSQSGIPYWKFATTLAPIAAISLVLTAMLIALVFRDEFRTWQTIGEDAQPIRPDLPLVIKSTVITLAMIGGFFLGRSPATVAIIAGALMLVTRRLEPEQVYAEIDWPLLVMFAGLFIVVGGLEKSMLSTTVIAAAGGLHLNQTWILGGFTAALSNLVSNVPAVLVLKPFVAQTSNPERAWLVVAMASTLAGNFTIMGSVANLIVAQQARAAGIAIGFWDYFKVGALLTVLTIVAGLLWL